MSNQDIFQLRWEGSFDAAHFIPGHPKCGRLHGHTYAVTVLLDGELPQDDSVPQYVIDYAAIKRVIMELDHKLIIPQHFIDGDEDQMTLQVSWTDFGAKNLLQVAGVMLAPIDEVESSAECLARYFVNKLREHPGLTRVEVRVSETPKTEAVFSWKL